MPESYFPAGYLTACTAVPGNSHMHTRKNASARMMLGQHWRSSVEYRKPMIAGFDGDTFGLNGNIFSAGVVCEHVEQSTAVIA